VGAAEGLGYDGDEPKEVKGGRIQGQSDCTTVLSGHKIEAHSELSTKNRGSIGYGFLRRGEKLSKGVERGETYREESSRRELSTAVGMPLKGPVGPEDN